jgi:radical SAM enzyme (TIGR01210 family)
MSHAAERQRVRSLRPAKAPIDPWHPLDVLVEEERGPDGRKERSMTVFLAGSECPFTCIFCDLWQYTLDRPTPAGAIPRQLEEALAAIDSSALPHSIKLYNASNFFESRAVPPEDLEIIAGQLAGFRRVTVECHPRLVGSSCRQFAELLNGDLEVAMGLETIHPAALPRLGKEMTLVDFESAAALLREAGIGMRAFVLLSPPFVPSRESVEWTIRTVQYALRLDVDVVSIIPLRPSPGEMERLAAAGHVELPTVEMLERSLCGSLASAQATVLADLWDVAALRGCDRCREARIDNLRGMNETGIASSPVTCEFCASEEPGGR